MTRQGMRLFSPVTLLALAIMVVAGIKAQSSTTTRTDLNETSQTTSSKKSRFFGPILNMPFEIMKGITGGGLGQQQPPQQQYPQYPPQYHQPQPQMPSNQYLQPRPNTVPNKPPKIPTMEELYPKGVKNQNGNLKPNSARAKPPPIPTMAEILKKMEPKS